MLQDAHAHNVIILNVCVEYRNESFRTIWECLFDKFGMSGCSGNCTLFSEFLVPFTNKNESFNLNLK